jgi:excinuclease ABC subunit A
VADIKDGITIKGAREHNLKNIDLFIPRNKLTVITGISGSGKSTVAFDTIYAEGQRRYVEGLSTYARQFLEQLKKPELDSITGLSPTISIEQKTTVASPRSTVGTITEIYDYFRLLFSRIGKPVCPDHGVELKKLDIDRLVDETLALKEGTKIHILAPVIRNKKGEFQKEIEGWLKKGFVRAKIDGEYFELESPPALLKTKNHNIELVIDRLIIKKDLRPRLVESLNIALKMAKGTVAIENISASDYHIYSKDSSCPICQYSPPDIEPRLFSFNDPRGYCHTCHGLGTVEEEVEEDVEDDTEEESEIYEEGDVCPDCKGSRLRKEAMYVLVDNQNIHSISILPFDKMLLWINKLKLSEREKKILHKLIFKINYKINFLLRLGLSHLSLSRSTRSLSGGEAQRIRLANQLGSPLVGVLYVLDEPSIGLHAKDHHELLKALDELKNKGNTIIIVEHDEETIRAADYVVDIGPRAGKFGGDIMAHGTPQEIERSSQSLTGKYLSGKVVAYALRPEKKFSEFLSVEHATGNNLKDVSVKIPLNSMTTVTGVSGSGKSTLIVDTLYKYLSNKFYVRDYSPAPFKKISGFEKLSGVIEINQKPIGRTPRSNPSTYTGLFSLVRDLFAQLPESRLRGYKPGRFSFNVKGGRCEACQGGGQIKVEMHFMADVYVQCDVCSGARYNPETLNVKFKDKSIADVLAMSIGEALVFFDKQPYIKQKLEILNVVGLDYLTLGQSSITLSGGEAQRIKLSKELSKKRAGQVLYILDEPSTGLHFEDTKKLIELLHRLVDQGHTVLVIEHNMDVIASSDHLIDLGPDSGEHGGELVAEGHPNIVMKNKNSYTGVYLKKHLRS